MGAGRDLPASRAEVGAEFIAALSVTGEAGNVLGIGSAQMRGVSCLSRV
jgi:hypothetical protein